MGILLLKQYDCSEVSVSGQGSCPGPFQKDVPQLCLGGCSSDWIDVIIQEAKEWADQARQTSLLLQL